ncbi:hypothetical protein [Luteimicrobium subarcticum]|uniref:Uncharacterized protein n=1 Tax=Luteimicrobium subarcticum TaxID=620910 RepID=A0A2M8WR60_9MICO|nr:hypothetical protein [Luteimicrobium subarcticum]PJI93394.1 hypothetical protein CLV34_1963 [Luteimicrobium subarcticum]
MHLSPGRTHVLQSLPHHDGSATYVPPGVPRLGDVVPVRLRVPRTPDAPVPAEVRVRVVQDGDPRVLPVRPDRTTADESWFVAEVPVHNPVTSYRFFLGDPARGTATRDCPATVPRHVWRLA